MKKIKKLTVLISNKITSITHLFGFLAIVIGALLLIYDAYYLLSFGDGWEYINNIIVEAHGLVFDLLVLGVLISIYERRRQKKEAIEREENLIDDFRRWDEKEAMYRIVGAVKRLNKLGVTKIDLTDCFLQEANFQSVNLFEADLSSANLQGANLMGINLQHATLALTDLRGANLMTTDLAAAILDGANLENAELQGVNLERAELKNANLKGAKLEKGIIPYRDPKSITSVRAKFQPANLKEVGLLNAIVGKNWFELLEKWEVKGLEEITDKYYVNEEGIIIGIGEDVY